MSISFNEAINTLHSMFPSWDREAIGTILVASDGSMSACIDMLMSFQTEDSSQIQTEDNNSNDSNEIVTISEPTPISSTAVNLLDGYDDEQGDIGQNPSSRTSSNSQVTNNAADVGRFVNSNSFENRANNNRQYRGIRCNLPNDFLKLPKNIKIQSRILPDEELAAMLQNELFQRELVNNGFHANNGSPQGLFSSGNTTNASSPSHTHTLAPSIPDLGIMKSLSLMSETAKRNLNNLAVRFSSNENQNENQNQNGRKERGNHYEMRRLVDNDEEEDEVISFDDPTATSSEHVLNGYGKKDNQYWTQNPVLDAKESKP